jgi:hypothetical protein
MRILRPHCRLFLLFIVICFGLNVVVVNPWGCRRWIDTRTCQTHARAITFEVEGDCTFESKCNARSILNSEIVIIEPNSTTPIPESPRLWLESSPFGAYTVIRCDYHHTDATSSCPPGGFWCIWGRDFHLQRLRDSMHSLTSLTSVQPTTCNISSGDLDHACMLTEAILDRLSSINRNLKDIFLLEPTTATTTVVMITILWYESSSAGGKNPIIVRAHASCIDNKIALGKSRFESASIAEWNNTMDLSSVQKCTIVVDAASNVADRQHYPQPYAKISSWCKQRKPLEKQYMPQSMLVSKERILDPVSVDEVILTERIKSESGSSVDSHLLEGLTSNLFVVYPENVIRTAGQGILHGYARHLAMQAIRTRPHSAFASRAPYWTLDTVTPISLSDAHLWQEVFCTSAIRLIVPVDRMLVPILEDCECIAPVSNGMTAVKEIWRYKEGLRPQIWKQILAFLLLIQLEETCRTRTNRS